MIVRRGHFPVPLLYPISREIIAQAEHRDVPRRELDVRFFSGRVRDKIRIIIAI
jgi:hypothetical protein